MPLVSICNDSSDNSRRVFDKSDRWNLSVWSGKVGLVVGDLIAVDKLDGRVTCEGWLMRAEA